MRLVDARAVDAVLCFKWDRFIREPLDLEYLIPRFDKGRGAVRRGGREHRPGHRLRAARTPGS